MAPETLTRYAWLSIAAALATIALKAAGWWITGSVGMLSDAIESVINLAAALLALAMLSLAAQPPDEKHPYGHDKAEYFSSSFEGLLIVVAALGIASAAIERLLHPRPLDALIAGLAAVVAASMINFATARALLTVARRYHSIALEADAQHLLTDVWTSAAVVAAVGLVWLTGWLWLDPAIALVVAGNILHTGWGLLRRSASGLMDASLPAGELAAIDSVLESYRPHGLDFHALRTRRAGARTFVTLHVLVPGDWTVRAGHDWSERIEADVRRAVPNAHLTLHLEPVEDPISMHDQGLDRTGH